MLLVSAAQMIVAWAAGKVVVAMASGDTARALAPASLGAAAAFARVGASWWVASTEVSLSRRIGEQLRDRVLSSLLAGQQRQGPDDVFRILGSIREVEQAALIGGLGGIRALAVLLPLLLAVVVLVPGSLLLGVAVLAPFGLALAWVRRTLQKDERRALELTAQLEQQLDTLVRHAELWRVAGSGDVARQQIRDLSSEARRSLASARGRRAALSALNEALAALGVLLLVTASLRGWLGQQSEPLMIFALLIALAYRPLRDWGDAQGAWVSGKLALQWLAPWLQAHTDTSPPRPTWPLEAIHADGFGAVRHPHRWSFELEPGSLVLVVGPNGGGKTTLLRALLGLEPTEGSLHYGGARLGGRGVGPAQRPFAWSPQEAPLLSLSLEQNLALGGSLDQARAWLGESWGEAFCGPVLGDGGRALSGGERAWVSIARACASGLPVLLLDEPTASLDSAAEARLIAQLAGLRGHRTIIVVTHRPERWPDADQVLRV